MPTSASSGRSLRDCATRRGGRQCPAASSITSPESEWLRVRLFCAFAQSPCQTIQNEIWHEARDISAKSCDFLHQRGREEGVLGTGRNEDGLDIGQRRVHLSHLQLIVEVA